MAQESSQLLFGLENINPQTSRATITVPAHFVNSLYTHAAKTQQKKVHVPGFAPGNAPLEYIKSHYTTHLNEYVQQFLFKYTVIDFLYEKIHEKKIPVAGQPRLESTFIKEGHPAVFVFSLSLTEPIEFKEWKHFGFKAPKRKKYKDIDRQVDTFIEEEMRAYKEKKDDAIDVGDWINFQCAVHDKDNNPLFGDHTQSLWIKIGDEEADNQNREQFVGKRHHETFFTEDGALYDYFEHELSPEYRFNINITEVVPFKYFSFDDFKRHFRVKSQKEMHHKLIEVFSYRNDFSQRRAMVEDALKLLLSKHRFEVPNHIMLRQQEIVLHEVQTNPDYPVYKTERQFENYVKMLASKQAKEMILIDQIAHREHVQITNDDIRGYLNFLKRPRTKEFIYFQLPPTKVNGQEMPIPHELLKHYCTREKTLNHIIYHLNRK
jgi:trigger factor